MKLNAFLPKLCACISGMAEGPCPRVDLRRPGLRAGQCQGFALPRPARTAPGGPRRAPARRAGLRKWPFAGFARTSARPDLAQGAGSRCGGPGPLAPARTLGPRAAARALTYCVTATCTAEKRGPGPGVGRRLRLRPGCVPPAAGRARSEPERANQAWAPGPRAARSSRRCGPAARLYPKVTLLYRPPLRSTKLKERQQTSRGKAASWLDSKGPYLGVLGSERRSGWSFPSCAQARSRDICFPYAPRHRQILDYMLPSSPPLVVFPTRPGR